MRHFAASQFVRKDKDQEGMQKLASEVGYRLDAKRHVAILYRVNHLPGNWKKTDYELYYFTVENVFCELLGEKNCCISYSPSGYRAKKPSEGERTRTCSRQ